MLQIKLPLQSPSSHTECTFKSNLLMYNSTLCQLPRKAADEFPRAWVHVTHMGDPWPGAVLVVGATWRVEEQMRIFVSFFLSDVVPFK